ncbi:MAG: LysR family transcriptional regulator [Pseudomonadota bacterium]
MMDRFSELKAFVSVVDAGGFSAAARDMGRSRSAVNRLVIALETRLSVQLLNRTTRSVSATSTGLALYERARRVLDDLQEIERLVGSAATNPAGKLRISAPQSLGDMDFPALIAGFMAECPQVEMDVVFDARLVDPVAEGFDLALRIAEPDEETMLVDHRVLELRYILCAAPAYLDSAAPLERPEDLARHAALYHRADGRRPAWSLSGPEGPVRAPVRPVLASNTLDVLRSAACAGLGVAMLPEYAVRSNLESNRLRPVLRDFSPPSRMLQIVYPATRHLSARVALFVGFVTRWCGGG